MGIHDDFTTCSYETGEDPSCSDSIDPSKLNIKDHKYYYGRDFVQYGISGCPDLVASKKSDLENSKFVEKRSKHFSRNF
uniref:Uncharacterized protein n=1 Tax=Panagrolaimus davidi TaxID=227884 RepID=A0A914QKJ4_9BILA